MIEISENIVFYPQNLGTKIKKSVFLGVFLDKTKSLFEDVFCENLSSIIYEKIYKKRNRQR